MGTPEHYGGDGYGKIGWETGGRLLAIKAGPISCFVFHA